MTHTEVKFATVIASCRLIVRLTWVGSLSLLLLACATPVVPKEPAVELARDDTGASLASLRDRANANPRSTEHQKAYLQAREASTAAWLAQAERLQAEGRSNDAAALYRRVLAVHPGHDLALRGLRQMERQALAKTLIEEARRGLLQRDWGQARSDLDAALRADPGSAEGLALQIELARQSAQPKAEARLSEAYRKLISLEFRDVPLRQIFEIVSKTSGLNFVFDKDVKLDQKASIFLKDSTVEDALYFLLLSNQIEQQAMNANTVLIYPGTVAKLKEYQELSVRTFQLVNTDVKAVAANIKALLKGRDVVADDKLNMLIARDTPDALRVIEKLVALHDVAEPEVMLEVEILEVSRTKLSELGVRWPDSLSLTPLASNAAVGLTLQDLRDLNSTTIGASLGGIKLNLKSENTGVNILANPKIRVTNREKAKVLIGDRVPVVTVTTSPTGGYAESVSYLDVGLKLDVEPVIYRGNDIVIKIALEVSNLVDTKVTKAGGVAYTLGTRNANTTLRLRDGENQILAGLINDEDRKSANKLPGLGDMPAVGRLFGSAVDDGKKSEIMLSITPRLIRNVYRPDAGVLEFSSGTEGSLRERPPVKVSKPAVAPVVTVTPAAAMAGKSNQILIAE